MSLLDEWKRKVRVPIPPLPRDIIIRTNSSDLVPIYFMVVEFPSSVSEEETTRNNTRMS